MKRVVKISLALITLIFAIICVLFFGYSNSLHKVSPKTIHYYNNLKSQLVKQGYQPSIFIISAKRQKWHNTLLTSFGAAKNSQHLNGTALDILVLDINQDGSIGKEDVKIVVDLLEPMIGDHGGIGTYTSEYFIWNRQMVHFDCRGYKARWRR